MAESYRKTCRYCGRTITMRKMPYGQWVPFDGYNARHDCKKASYSTPMRGGRQMASQSGWVEDLGFDDDFTLAEDKVRNNRSPQQSTALNISTSVRRSGPVPDAPKPQIVVPPVTSPSIDSKPGGSGERWKWVFWGIVILIILYVVFT